MPDSLAAALRAAVTGEVAVPGDAGYDAARAAYNVLLDQRPDAVVLAESTQDVAAAVRIAIGRGLRVAAQGTGHGAGPLASLEGALLVRTDRMTGVEVDAAARTARVRAGADWGAVAAACDPHGLAGLAGTAADVKVAGYSLGGGIGWLARAHGLACSSILAAEVVLADGRVVRADADSEPDLMWALRGGGGSFGVVTALEIALVPVPSVVGGILFFPHERAAEVLHAWREWTDGVPEATTSTGRLLQLPPLPELPDFLSGKSYAAVQLAHLGTVEEADAILRPLRALGPVIDTVAPMAPSGLAQINMDPPDPVPYAGDGSLLAGLPAAAIDAIVAAAGPGSGSRLLSLELRHLGGALARPAPRGGALDALPAPFVWFGVGIAPVPEAAEAVDADLDALHAALAPWDAGRSYLNFAERPVHGDRLFGDVHATLREVRARYDPDGVFLANHPVVPA